jgi:hypothetical protein
MYLFFGCALIDAQAPSRIFALPTVIASLGTLHFRRRPPPGETVFSSPFFRTSGSFRAAGRRIA